jgi:O-antigen ligase
MPYRHSRHDPLGARHTLWFTAASGVLLVLCWALGGVTVDSTGADELLQLLALPVLLLAAWRLTQVPINRTLAISLALAAAVVLVPLWQLLPLPGALGMAGEARAAITADLATAGASVDGVHASLWPRATEQALWSLLPALALFLSALTLPSHWRRRLLQLLLGLVLASAAFAFFQLSLPDGSPMLLYTSWGRNFGGLFVNANHQGSALILGGVIALALFIDARRRAREDESGHRHWLYAVLAAACVVMVPLANGSAAALLVVVGLVAVALMMGVLRRRREEGSPILLLRLVGAGLAVAVVVASALAWKQADTERQQIATATVAIGNRHAPLGTGVGSFVPVFAQSQDPRQARGEVINHAHNEYTQWWLEAGVPALLVLVAALGLFAWAGWQVLTNVDARRLRAIAAPAWTGLLILLLHSLVDFPLRTTALMATAGLLAGLLLATLDEAGRTIRSRSEGDDALRQA